MPTTLIHTYISSLLYAIFIYKGMDVCVCVWCRMCEWNEEHTPMRSRTDDKALNVSPIPVLFGYASGMLAFFDSRLLLCSTCISHVLGGRTHPTPTQKIWI